MMFNFFKKTVVLDVNPAFLVHQKADGVELVVDSGSQDINRTQPKKITLNTLDGYHLDFLDFNVIYNKYNSETKELHAQKGHAIYSLGGNINDQISTILSSLQSNQGVVLGVVNLVKDKEIIHLCQPIYIVNGVEKGGEVEFLDNQTVHDYIVGEWNDAFSFGKNNVKAIAGQPIEQTASLIDLDKNQSENANTLLSQSTEFKNNKKNNLIPLVAASVLGVGFAFSAFAYTQIGQSNEASKAESEQSSSNMSALAYLGSKDKAKSENKNSDDTTIREMVHAVSGSKNYGLTDLNGNSNNTQNMSVEDLATAQVKATEVMLKKMNIDVGANEDLGCLTQ